MDDEVLRDRNGRYLGRVDDRGTDLVLFDAMGHVVGSYNKNTDTTYDGLGRVFGTGYLLPALLYLEK